MISKKFFPCGFWGNEHFSAEKWLMCDVSYDDDGVETESNYKPLYIRYNGSEYQAIDDPNKLVPDLLLTIGATTWRFKPNLSLCNYASRQVVQHPSAVTYNYYKNLNFAGWGGVKYQAEDVNCPWVITNSMEGSMIFDMSTFNNPSTFVASYNRWLTPTSNNFGSNSESTGTIYVIRKTDLNKVLLKPYNTSTLDANFLTYIWSLLETEYCKEFYYISCETYGTLTKSDNALTDAGSLSPDMGTQFKSYWKLNAKTGVFEWQDTNPVPTGYDANIVFGCEVWSVTNPANKRVARFIYNKNQNKFVLWKYATGTNVSSYYSTYTFNPSYFYNIVQEEYTEDGETKKRWCYYMWNKPKGAVFTYQAVSYDGTVPQWYTSGLDSFVFTFKKFLPAHDAWTYVNWTLVKESNYVNPFNYTNNGTADADNVASNTASTNSYFQDHYWADMNDRYFNIIIGEDFK